MSNTQQSRSHIGVIVCLLMWWTVLLLVPIAEGQFEEGSDRMEVSAGESIEIGRGGDTVKARGNVEIRQRARVFGADTMEFRRSTRTLRAEGSVFFLDPRYRLEASRLEMNLEDETATMLDADVFIEQGHLSLSGKRLEKFTGQVYEAEEGRFTTCLCEVGSPPWSVGARALRLRRGGEVTADDATFYIYDVPVLSLPYVYFPHLSERTTGLLFPSFGWSNQDGLMYRQPFFWAPDKSSDVTLDLAVESKTRVGIGGQYRTVLNSTTDGRLDLAYVSERMRGSGSRVVADGEIADPEIPLDRWNVLLTHRHRDASGWITYSDVALYSDSLATRELMNFSGFSDGAGSLIRASRHSLARLGFYRHESAMTLEGAVDYQQDLVQPQEHVLHRIPHLAFRGSRTLDNRFDFGWDMQLTNFVREELTDGLRVDMRPQLTWPMIVGRHYRLATSVALRETLYRLNELESNFARSSSRELLELRGSLTTSLTRMYNWNKGMWTRGRHVIEPSIEYLFIPSTDQSRMPIWDSIDRINRRNLLTVAFANRFWGVRTASGTTRGVAHIDGGEYRTAHQFARARVGVSFDFDQSRKGSDGLSDIDMGLRLDPTPNIGIDAALGMDPGPWNLQQAALGFSLSGDPSIGTRKSDKDFGRPDSLSLTYRYIRENPLSQLAQYANLVTGEDCPGAGECPRREPLNGIEANVLFHVTDHVLLLYDGGYDGATGRMGTNRGAVKYLSKCQCWTATASVDRQINPHRTVFALKFNLLGLGS